MTITNAISNLNVAPQSPLSSSTIIIGAGPAGLATGGALHHLGKDCLLLEQSGYVGNAWRNHYERLHLHTAKSYSHLPHYDLPEEFARYPARQQVVRYLNDYAKHFQLEPKFYQKVTAITPLSPQSFNDITLTNQPVRWQVTSEDTQTGKISVFTCQNVVVATGFNHLPKMPQWQGMDSFNGEIIHSHAYKNGKVFEGKRVLVVGFGNSGAEIAIDLWEHGAKPSMSVRSPVNVLPKEIFGFPTLAMGIWQQHLPSKLADMISKIGMRLTMGDLTQYGLQPMQHGPMTEIRKNDRVPMLDIGTISLIKRGEITVYPGIQSISGSTVTFTDNHQADFDSILTATGYQPKVAELLPNDLVQKLIYNGRPTISGEESCAKGLYFIGFDISPAGMFRKIAIEAKNIAQKI